MALAILCIVVLASGLQRLTGVGFAMMTAPFLVVLVGPHGGVMLTNLLTAVAPLLAIPLVWRDIEWSKLAIIAPVGILVMPFFGALAATAAPGPLYMVVAVLVISGLTCSLLIRRIKAVVDGLTTRTLTGIGVGGGVVLAGVGGPAITIYAMLSRWEIRSFAATMQPLWVLMATGGFVSKLVFSGNEIPAMPWWFWFASLAAIVVGLSGATLMRSWIGDRLAQRTVMVLAFLGAGISLLIGVRETLGL